MKRIVSIIAAAALAVCSLSAQELANFAMGGGNRIVSPEVKDGKVTFRLSANYATRVQLSGNWMANPWTGTEEMTKGADGVWEITIDAPEPEIYTYNFIVDGVAVNDPLNDKVQRDGSRYLNMLFIPGERSENYYEATKHGTVTYRWYNSPSLGISRRMTVYLPYGYEDNPKQKYPVLYLLHGGGGDEEAWTSMGRAAQIMDNLIEKGLAKPMIVVMPNGNPNQRAANTLGLETIALDRNNPAFANAYVNSLVKEIIPFIEKEYRAIPKADSRAIAGLSMGGGHTTSATILYPGVFGYICPLSCGIRDSDHLDADLQGIKKAGYKLYWIGVGKEDTGAYNGSLILDEALTRNGMPHTLYVSDDAHVWKNWRLYLNTFARLLFK
ncbi:MAG: esterase [Bacteroidales bacterium]|nr:esterase [Bacteroidales bacterium]MBQ9173854.1 esterase [Bacteroidales bacterium]MBQ9711489.1 esterase [Bacteroidales bacterium]MBR1434777.1 esterase [Bacteroidales bacterium]